MATQTLAAKVESLEHRVTALEELPDRIGRLESQILQFREEVRAEFSAIREEIRAGDETVMRSLREEIRAGDETVVRSLREEIRAGDEETRRVLRAEMRAVGDEIMGQTRALYEDLKATIAVMHEGRPAGRRKHS